MKRSILAVLFVCITLSFTGCGDWNYDYYDYYYPYPPNPPPSIVTDIFSEPAFDGNISKNPVTSALTVTRGPVPSVFAGTDPVAGEEFRAFFDFPLTGAGGVPGNVFIHSAILNILIKDIVTPLNGTIQVFIDLVSYPQPLSGADFDSTFLATVSVPLFQTDFGKFVDIDVTQLMVQAQNRGLTDFQIRIIVDTPTGFIEIDDTDLNAPRLRVTYSSNLMR